MEYPLLSSAVYINTVCLGISFLFFSSKFQITKRGDAAHIVCNVSLFFPHVNVPDIDQDASFFNISEWMIDRGSKCSHGRGEVHVCIHEWGDILIVFTDLLDQDLVIFFKCCSCKQRIQE